jgi:hypothetical protein
MRKKDQNGAIANTVFTTGNWHFFAKYLFIYLKK